MSFKLARQINNDELAEKENFTFECNYQSGETEMKDIIGCRLLGIKTRNWNPPFPVPTFENGPNDIQWVKISGSEY